MNYRHAYHAGNICDVVKHCALTLVLKRLREKDAPFTVIDTHAGTGLYDLMGEQAVKTGEADAGIIRLMKAPEIEGLAEYYDIIKELNPSGEISLYPGSPFIAAKAMRPSDSLIACELHPEDGGLLKKNMYKFTNAHVHRRDGYEAIKGLLPPATRRGVILIDPPYENPEERSHLTEAIKAAYAKWATGQYIIWYPIKDRPAIWRWQEEMAKTGIIRQLCAEFIYEPEIRSDILNGSGLLFINPPWKFDEEIKALFSALHKALKTEHRGDNVWWLVGE